MTFMLMKRPQTYHPDEVFPNNPIITVFCKESSKWQYLAGMWIPHWHCIFQLERSQCE